MTDIERGTMIRLLISVTLAVIAVLLFILNRHVEGKTPEELEREFVLAAQTIDKEVDIVLEHFGIEKAWVRKKEISDPERHFTRVERLVAIPPTIIPAMMNRQLNALAGRYQGRAVATENLKENSITIHIILQQSVIQTIILKVKPESKNVPHIERKVPSEQLKKV